MDAKTMTRMLRDTAEAMERLACGEAGLLDNSDTAADVAALLMEVLAIAQLIEDETGTRVSRISDTDIESLTAGWMEQADKVAERRGE